MRYLLLFVLCVLSIVTGYSQNVGIGTSSPADKLTVQTATGLYGITHTDGSIRLSTFLGGSNGGGWLGTVSNHPLNFFTNNSPVQLTIATSGSVGIGTASPVFKLHVKTTGNTYGMIHENGDVYAGTFIGSYNGFNGGWYGTYSNHPLAFYTNGGAAQMTLLQNGHVGIATISPQAALDVYRIPTGIGTALFRGTTYGSVFNYSTTEDTYIRGGKAGSRVIINDAALGNVGIGTDAPADKLSVFTSTNSYGMTHTDGNIVAGSYVGFGGGWYGTKTNHPLRFFVNNGNAALEVRTDNIVSANNAFMIKAFDNFNYWILGTSNDATLYFIGNGVLAAYVDNDGDWVSQSDKKLKKDFIPYKPVLKNVKDLQIVTYQLLSNLKGERSFGLIAQNVAENFPEIVSEHTDSTGNKTLGVVYAKTGVLALKAIQEQQVIIEDQQQKINALEKRMAALEKLLQDKL